MTVPLCGSVKALSPRSYEVVTTREPVFASTDAGASTAFPAAPPWPRT
ncbi:hypothetical protein [Streptomyces sp. NPDC005799]